jgi:uncharacterized protein
MIDDDIEIIKSPLCQEITQDGHTIQVEIYEDGEGRWILEAVDEYGNSTIWDDHFETDHAAVEYLNQAIKEEGFESLIGEPPGLKSNLQDAGLTDDEMDELDAFLLSDATSDETMMLDQLDGYLTAIVSGPVTVIPSKWLPRVWGPSSRHEPVFDTVEQAMRINSLIMRHMNGIIADLQDAPDGYSPLVDITVYQEDPHEYADGEMWAYGYLNGIELCRTDWNEFFKQADSENIMRPIRLLGDDDLPEDQLKLTETPQQREELTSELAASAVRIYQFWLPYRQAIHERTIATTYQREHPKIGRNDPCPCGSGKKFKRCCGASTTLH